MTKPAEAPRLLGWVTASEAAELLGVSRQAVNDMIRAGNFQSLHTLGVARRPQYIVQQQEVEVMRSQRAASHAGVRKSAE